ncbi:MAG: DUF5606 domain-containing protein [Flavitalea sp.]
MEYGKIIAVTGMPGLFELLSSKNDGAIVRSLEDKTSKFVSSRVHNFSHLESIEVFTVTDNVNLSEIFQAMEKSESKTPDTKDASALKKYFEKVYPDLDFERVYSSDLKKMVKWFAVLKENAIEIKLTPVPEETEAEEEETEAPVVTEKVAAPKKEKKAIKEEEPAEEHAKPKKAAPKKKAEPVKEEKKSESKKESAEKKPAKKAAPKKKAKE